MFRRRQDMPEQNSDPPLDPELKSMIRAKLPDTEEAHITRNLRSLYDDGVTKLSHLVFLQPECIQSLPVSSMVRSAILQYLKEKVGAGLGAQELKDKEPMISEEIRNQPEALYQPRLTVAASGDGDLFENYSIGGECYTELRVVISDRCCYDDYVDIKSISQHAPGLWRQAAIEKGFDLDEMWTSPVKVMANDGSTLFYHSHWHFPETCDLDHPERIFDTADSSLQSLLRDFSDVNLTNVLSKFPLTMVMKARKKFSFEELLNPGLLGDIKTNEQLHMIWYEAVQAVQEKVKLRQSRITWPVPEKFDEGQYVKDLDGPSSHIFDDMWMFDKIYSTFSLLGQGEDDGWVAPPDHKPIPISDLCRIGWNYLTDWSLHCVTEKHKEILAAAPTRTPEGKYIIDLRLFNSGIMLKRLYDHTASGWDSCADFSYYDFRGAVAGSTLLFREAKANCAKFKSMKAKNTDFSKLEANGAEFEDVQAEGAHFENVQANGACFKGMEAEDAVFRNLQANGSDFREMKVKRCNFTDAEARGANFDKAQIVQCTCTRMKISSASTFTGTILVESVDIDKMDYDFSFQPKFAVETKVQPSTGSLIAGLKDWVKQVCKSLLSQVSSGEEDDEDDGPEDSDEEDEDEGDAEDRVQNLFQDKDSLASKVSSRTLGFSGYQYSSCPEESQGIQDLLQNAMGSISEVVKEGSDDERAEKTIGTLASRLLDSSTHNKFCESVNLGFNKIVDRLEKRANKADLLVTKAQDDFKKTLQRKIDALTQSLKNGGQEKIDESELKGLLQTMRSGIADNVNTLLSEQLQKVGDPAALMKSLAKEKLEGLTGLDHRGWFAFIVTPLSETISTEKELERLREDLAKLGGTVTQQTWVDQYNEWRILLEFTPKLKHHGAIKTMKHIMSLKDGDDKTVLQHLALVQILSKIDKPASPPEGVLTALRAANSIVKEHLNEIMLGLDRELMAINKIQSKKRMAFSLLGSMLLSSLITLGNMFTREEHAFVVNMINGTTFV